MPQKIHYRDDLYILSVLVKSLEACLAVEADPEYFRERLLGEIGFLDRSLRAFHELLAQNTHLIDREEYLKLLERSVRDFASALDSLLEGQVPGRADFEADVPRLRALLEGQLELAAELASLRSAAGGAEGNEVDLVSQDELSQLLEG